MKEKEGDKNEKSNEGKKGKNAKGLNIFNV